MNKPVCWIAGISLALCSLLAGCSRGSNEGMSPAESADRACYFADGAATAMSLSVALEKAEGALRLAKSAQKRSGDYDDLAIVLTKWRDMQVDILNRSDTDNMGARWDAIDIDLERVCGPIGSHSPE